MDIYKDTWQVEMPTMPNFIYMHLLNRAVFTLTHNYTRYLVGAQVVFRKVPCRAGGFLFPTMNPHTVLFIFLTKT